MKKLKSTLPNMVIVLGLIAALTALLLAYVYSVTKEPIELSKQNKLNTAIEEVINGTDKTKEYKVKDINSSDTLIFYDAFNKDGDFLGTAVQTFDKEGFGGEIVLLVSFDEDGNIIKTFALEHSETPGLGDKISNSKSDFYKQFENKNPNEFKLMVKKDKGDVDAITAATISSRAYCRAVQRAVDTYNAEKGGVK